MINVNMTDKAGVTLATAGKYCADNVKVTPSADILRKDEQAKTATPTTSAQDITPDAGKALSKVTVNPITADIVGNLDASSFAASIVAAIEGKGVTVPDGTLLDGMAALIESIEEGGTSAEKAFAPMPDVSSSGIIPKAVVPFPSKFSYIGSYTNSSAELSASISVNSGDTVIAGVAMRSITALPAIPDEWEVLQYVPAAPEDTETKQCLLVLKATASTDGELSLTLSQENASQRFYMLLVNLKDSTVYGGTQYGGTYSEGNFSLELPYEHSLVLASAPIVSTSSGSGSWRIYSVFAEKYMADFKDNAAYGGRLCAMTVPYKSQQSEDVLRGNIFTASTIPAPLAYIVFYILGITPGKNTRWLMSSGVNAILV